MLWACLIGAILDYIDHYFRSHSRITLRKSGNAAYYRPLICRRSPRLPRFLLDVLFEMALILPRSYKYDTLFEG